MLGAIGCCLLRLFNFLSTHRPGGAWRGGIYGAGDDRLYRTRRVAGRRVGRGFRLAAEGAECEQGDNNHFI